MVLSRTSSFISLSSVSSLNKSFSTNDISATPTTDHPLYYLTDGNLKLQLDDGTVYNVHRYFFDAYSSRFAEEHLDDIHRVDDEEPVIKLLDVTREDFDRFLSLIYPSAIGVRDVYTADEWLSVLRLATQWSFDELRALAIRELEPIASAVDKIVTARELGKPEWLLPALVDVCMAPKWLNLEDAERLGMKTVVEIGRIREEMREARDWSREDVARALERSGLTIPREATSEGEDEFQHEERKSEEEDSGIASPREEFRTASPREEFVHETPTTLGNGPTLNPGSSIETVTSHKDVSVSTLSAVEPCIATTRDASTSTTEADSHLVGVPDSTAEDDCEAVDVVTHGAPDSESVTAEDEVQSVTTEDEVQPVTAENEVQSVISVDEVSSVNTEDEEADVILSALTPPPPAAAVHTSAPIHTSAPNPAAEPNVNPAANPNDTPACISEPPSEAPDVAQDTPVSAKRGDTPTSANRGEEPDALDESAEDRDVRSKKLRERVEEPDASVGRASLTDVFIEAAYPANASTSFTEVVLALQEGSTAEDWQARSFELEQSASSLGETTLSSSSSATGRSTLPNGLSTSSVGRSTSSVGRPTSTPKSSQATNPASPDKRPRAELLPTTKATTSSSSAPSGLYSSVMREAPMPAKSTTSSTKSTISSTRPASSSQPSFLRHLALIAAQSSLAKSHPQPSAQPPSQEQSNAPKAAPTASAVSTIKVYDDLTHRVTEGADAHKDLPRHLMSPLPPPPGRISRRSMHFSSSDDPFVVDDSRATPAKRCTATAKKCTATAEERGMTKSTPAKKVPGPAPAPPAARTAIAGQAPGPSHRPSSTHSTAQRGHATQDFDYWRVIDALKCTQASAGPASEPSTAAARTSKETATLPKVTAVKEPAAQEPTSGSGLFSPAKASSSKHHRWSSARDERETSSKHGQASSSTHEHASSSKHDKSSSSKQTGSNHDKGTRSSTRPSPDSLGPSGRFTIRQEEEMRKKLPLFELLMNGVDPWPEDSEPSRKKQRRSSSRGKRARYDY